VDLNPARPNPLRRAAIANLGCKVNQAEMDAVERLLRARGIDLVGAHEAADLVVVNTCTVTSIADQKSRQAVRRARRTSPAAQVLVTGCSVAVDAESLAAADPAARLFGNESKDQLLTELAALLDIPNGAELPSLSGVDAAVAPGRPAGLEVDEGSVEDAFEREIDRTRVFVKIQDGCSFHCTYCIIPRARGPERSVPAEAVLADVRRAHSAGHREVVLTGINAGTYEAVGLGGGGRGGLDGGGRGGLGGGGRGGLGSGTGTGSGSGAGAGAGVRPGLPGLVGRILAETEIERIRLSSIEPQHVTADLLEVWAGAEGRCLPHFHIPLQSGDDAILRRMGRRYDTASYGELMGRLQRAIPGVAVHADLIVGFPGEDDAAWARTVAFLRSLDLAGIHVFRYSARPGTAAARMVGQVDPRTKKRRSAQALALAAEARTRFAARQLGGELCVLFERQLPNGRWLGHAENHVLVEAAAPGSGSMENVIGLVRAESIDPEVPERIVGRVLATDPPAG
jgi:threonylcarbamoyladenosine tRNA methylthiotransferase MtaB